MIRPPNHASRRKPIRHARCCQLERLESRDLLAGDTPLVLSGGAVDDLQPTGSQTGSIGGQVVLAAGRPCDQYTGTPVENVTLRLLDEQGELVRHTESDAQGAYQFDDVEPGVYAVQQIQPTSLQTGKAHVGTGGGIVFESNLIGEIVLNGGDVFDSYNFCELPLAVAPDQTEPADHVIEAHGGGGSTSAEQLVGAAQRFGQSELHSQPMSDKIVRDDESQAADDPSPAELELPADSVGSSERKSSSQEAKPRPSTQNLEIPEELWEAIDTIGIDPLFAFAEELPWVEAHDSQPAQVPHSQTSQSAQQNVPVEENDSPPASEPEGPAQMATNVNTAEGASPESSDRLRQ